MGNILKLGVAYWLAPPLVGVVAVLIGSAMGIGLVLALAALGVIAFGVLAWSFGGPVLAYVGKRFHSFRSPVRRRAPRPTAWHQWR